MEDKKFLQYFDQLIQTKENQITAQRTAIFKIVQVLSKSKHTEQQKSKLLDKKYQYGSRCFSDLSYTLTRFIKGIASLSPSVKQGFYLGYSVVCANFKQYISIQILLKTIVFAMKRLPQAMKPSENCHRLIGELMLINGIVEVFYSKEKSLKFVGQGGEGGDEIGQTYKLINSQLTDIYRENFLNVYGKRGGQTSTVSLLWLEVVQNLFEKCLNSKPIFQKVLNDLNEKVEGIQQSEKEEKFQSDNRILWGSAWVSAKFMIILKSQIELEHKIPLTTLPFVCDDPIQLLKATNSHGEDSLLVKLVKIIKKAKILEHPLSQYLGKYFSLLGYHLQTEKVKNFWNLFIHDGLFNISQEFSLKCINSCINSITSQFQQKELKDFKSKFLNKLLFNILTDKLIQKISHLIQFQSKQPDSKKLALQLIQNLKNLANNLKQKKQAKTLFKLLNTLFQNSKHLPVSSQCKPLLISIVKGIVSCNSMKEQKLEQFLNKEHQKLNEINHGSNQDSEDKKTSDQKQFNYQLNKLLILHQHLQRDNEKMAKVLIKYCSLHLSKAKTNLNLKNIQLCFTKLPSICQNSKKNDSELCQNLLLIIGVFQSSIKEKSYRNYEILNRSCDITKEMRQAIKVLEEGCNGTSSKKLLQKRKHSQVEQERLKQQIKKIQSLINLINSIVLIEIVENQCKSIMNEYDPSHSNMKSSETDLEALQTVKNDLDDIEKIFQMTNLRKKSNIQKSNQQEEKTNPMEVLFDLFTSQLTKSSSCLKQFVKQAFLQYLNDIPESAITNMLDLLSTPTDIARNMLSI